MTLYLTDNLGPEEIVRAKAAGVVACKLYPQVPRPIPTMA
jgi:dihydroorotase